MSEKQYEKQYQNLALSFRERASDLVGRMTLEEKISQMLYNAPAIERLDIPAYNWWGEGLHGVARAGTATVFPQAIGLAATFDRQLLQEIASVIADESRAKHHEAARRGDRGIYRGLTLWAPNINIFRDPRWGRGHETYGEDPYLTGELGVAFVRGLQGDHPRYLKTAACAKHFAVHSGPEGKRHSFNAEVSARDLWDTYLPAFEKVVIEGKVEAVMGAYNRVNGEPCCGSKTLLHDILRNRWNFTGHVVSDCGAIVDFHEHHKVTKTPEESAALAVQAGSDLNCGHTYQSLVKAVGQGLLSEQVIDIACIRLFEARMKLGMFDPPEVVPNADISYMCCDQPKHHVLSLEAARRAMVLLKNAGSALPLDREHLRTLAVIGPNADDGSMLLGNYHGTPSRTVTPLRGIQDLAAEGSGELRVLYARGCELVEDRAADRLPSEERFSEAVSAALQADAAVICVGLNAQYEGEAGDAHNAEASGDRESLALPGYQQELIDAVTATGVCTVVVNFSGGSIDFTQVDSQVDAIIQAWYPGPEGGTALAELLFGMADFSGRLPVTWVRSIADLPPFEDYSMVNRTYRYLQNEPLYPFGYGLSCNTYHFHDLVLEDSELKPGWNLYGSIAVTNHSEHPGHTVLQVYLKDLEASVPVPHFKLVTFQALRLRAGQTKVLPFCIEADQMAVITDTGEKLLEPGRFIVYVGGQAPDARSAALSGQYVSEAEFIITNKT